MHKDRQAGQREIYTQKSFKNMPLYLIKDEFTAGSRQSRSLTNTTWNNNGQATSRARGCLLKNEKSISSWKEQWLYGNVWLDNYMSGANGTAPPLITRRRILLKLQHSRRMLKLGKLSHRRAHTHANTQHQKPSDNDSFSEICVL